MLFDFQKKALSDMLNRPELQICVNSKIKIPDCAEPRMLALTSTPIFKSNWYQYVMGSKATTALNLMVYETLMQAAYPTVQVDAEATPNYEKLLARVFDYCNVKSPLSPIAKAMAYDDPKPLVNLTVLNDDILQIGARAVFKYVPPIKRKQV